MAGFIPRLTTTRRAINKLSEQMLHAHECPDPIRRVVDMYKQTLGVDGYNYGCPGDRNRRSSTVLPRRNHAAGTIPSHLTRRPPAKHDPSSQSRAAPLHGSSANLTLLRSVVRSSSRGS